MLTNFKQHFIALIKTRKVLICGAVFLIIVFCFFRSTPQKIVFFDFKSTYAIFLEEAVHKKLSQAETSQLGLRFPIAVSNAVASFAKSHNAVVLVKGAVIAGGSDVTHEIQLLIAKEMQRLARETSNE